MLDLLLRSPALLCIGMTRTCREIQLSSYRAPDSDISVSPGLDPLGPSVDVIFVVHWPASDLAADDVTHMQAPKVRSESIPPRP